MGKAFPRTCGYRWQLELCGKSMTRHYQTSDGLTWGACREHLGDMESVLERKGRHVTQVHACGPNCCMPNSIWDTVENVCRYEEDELGTLVTEEKELELVG